MSHATRQANAHRKSGSPRAARPQSQALKFKKRMLEWSNPVEFVNNMYGCHPGDKDVGYFASIFNR